MANDITFSKELLDNAKKQDKDVFAFGSASSKVICLVEKGLAGKLVLFCLKIREGKSPKEAFRVVFEK